MAAKKLHCQVCSKPDHGATSCADRLPFSIVLLQIDDATPEQVMRALQVALQRAASSLATEPN
jgi:hypothetical protein